MMMCGAQVYTVGLDWGHAKARKSLWRCIVPRCTLLGRIEATPRHASLYDDVWCTGVHGWAGLRPRRGTQVSGTWRQSGEKQGRQRNPLSRLAIGEREADSTNCLSCIQGWHLAFTFVNFSGFHVVNLVFSAFVCPVFFHLSSILTAIFAESGLASFPLFVSEENFEDKCKWKDQWQKFIMCRTCCPTNVWQNSDSNANPWLYNRRTIHWDIFASRATRFLFDGYRCFNAGSQTPVPLLPFYLCIYFPFGILQYTSVLWRCWLGGRKGIRPVKNWAVGCWRGCLSGARCRLAYGPADATATHCLLLH